MLPLFKVMSLLIRVFARPMIARTKEFHMRNKDKKKGIIRKFFIFMGNRYHKIETKLNSQFLKLANEDFFVKPLNEEQAIEKGVEFFYEILFYSILIGLPTYEMYKATVDAHKKSEKQEERLKLIESEVIQIKEYQAEQDQNMKDINNLHEVLMQKITLLPRNIKVETNANKEKNQEKLLQEITFLNEQLSVRLNVYNQMKPTFSLAGITAQTSNQQKS